MAESGVQLHGVGSGSLRVDPTEINAEGGPIYPRLKVPLHLDFDPAGTGQQDQFFTILAIECGLFLAEHMLKISDATPITDLFTVRSYGASTTWNLEFPLDAYRVKGLEARRHGDLKVRFDFAFVVGLQSRVAFPDKPNQGARDVLAGFQKVNSQIYVEVPQSHWVGRVLPGLGSSAYFIVEVPSGNEHIAPAWALIGKAESAFGRWDTKAVFAHCREAATALTNLIDKHCGQNSFSRQERWARAIKEFNHFASLGLHLEEKEAEAKYSADQVRIEKPDAECLLIFVKALAKYAEELITREGSASAVGKRATVV